jgi:hypothetical protein
LWIRIRIHMDPHCFRSAKSGSRRAKVTTKNRKGVIFMF